MADIKSLIDKFNIFRTKDSILNDVAKDNGQITIDIKQPFSDDIDSNNSLKTKLETNIKDKLFNTEINNVGSNIFDEKIKPFDKGYNVSNTPDTDTKTPIDTTPIKPDTPTIEKNTADATNIQQEKIQQPEITTQEPEPEATQQYKTIIIQKKPKLTTDSLGNYMPIDLDKRKGKSYSGAGEQQIDEIFNRLDTPEKFDMFMWSVSKAYDQLKSANLNDNENIIFLPYSYDHENGNMNGITLTFGGRQKEWAEKQLKILAKGINDKQNEEWLSNLELPQPKTTMDKITSKTWLQLFSFMQPPTNEMDPKSASILESGQKENRLNAIKWGLIENIKECKDILDKYYKDKSQVGIALSVKNITETINNVIFPQIDLVKQSEIKSIISKYKENPKSLTPIENEIVKYYSDYVNALSVVANKTSTGYETTKAIETSLPFMTDFLRFNLVGSATRGGTRAAMKIGGKGLARQIAKDTPKTIGARAFKLGEDILTAAGHTSVSPLTYTNMLENYSQTMETNGQYTKNDLRRGVIEAFTENFSERMFGALKGILPKSNNAFVNSLFGNNPVIKTMQKHMNVGGLLEETGEEYAGAFVNTMFGFALGDEKLASSFKEQLNNSVPTILSIGITVGLPQAIGMGIDFREIKKMNTRFNVAEDNLKQYFNKENSYLDINRYSDALKSLYINLNNAKYEEDKAEIKGKIAELNKTAANLAMEKGDSNGFILISEYSIAAQNSFYVTNKAMSELKNMSEEDRTKLVDNAINKLKNDFTNNLNWSLISRAAANNITDQNGKQHPTCFLYTDNGVTYVLNGQKDNMFYFVDVNGNTISKSADELRNNENLSVLHLNNLLSSFSNKELEDINSKFIDIAQYNAGYRYKVNDNGEIRYYTDNKDLIKSNIPYEQINRDKIESNLVGSYDLVRIDNITYAVEDMANAFAEPATEQTSTEQTSTEQQKPAQEPAQEQTTEEQPQEQTAQEPAQEQPIQEQPSEEPIQEQPQEQTTQETAQEQPIQEQTTEEQETTEQEPIQPTQQEQTAQEEDNSTAQNEQENTKSQGKKPNIRRIGRVIGSSLSTDEFISETMSIVIKDVKTFPKEIRDEDIISKEQKSGKRKAGIKVKVGLLGNDLYIQYRKGRSFANKDKELWEKEKRWYWATIKIPNATNYSAGQLRYRLDYAGTTTDIARIVSDAVLELFNKKELRLHKGSGIGNVSIQEAALRDAIIDKLREAGIEVITDVEEAQRVLDEANGKGVSFFRTADGNAYGFTVGGKIYIDPRIATADTPIHEYAHLWASAMQKLNPNEWENIVKLMKGTPIWEEVKRNYPELTTDNEIADEVLAFYSGNRGAERLREEHAKILKGNGNVVEKVKAINAIKRVKEALKRFWKNVAEWFGIHFTTAEEVADKVLSDLLNGVNPTLAGVENDIRFEENSEEADIVARAKADGTYMKAPNGKKSNLSPRQWVQVRTKAFKDWFGDWENDPDNSSKVIDENGEPMVVYHGTTNDETEQKWNEKLKSYDTAHKQFTIFRRNTGGERNYGMFFNSDMDNAFAYGYYTYSVYLNIKNPLEIDCNNSSYDKIRYNGEVKDTYEWAKWAEKNGYDGVIFRNIRDGVDFNSMNESTNDYVTFASNQIKSATDNVGTFDKNNPDIRYRRASNRSVISSRFERQAEIQREEKNTKSAANIVLGNANVVLNDTNIFDKQYQNAIDNNLIDENVSPLIDSFGITWGYQLKNGVIVINKDVFVSDILDKRVKDNLSLLISSLMKTNKTFFKEGISFFKKLPIWVLYKNDTKSNEDTIKEIINDILLGNTSIDTNKLELLKQYTVQDMNDILDNATKWFEKFEGISSNMFAGNSISDILDTTLGDLMPKEITTTQEGKRLNWFSKLGIDIRSKLFDSLDWFRVVSDKTKDKTASELYDAMIVHTKRVQGKIDIFDKEYVRPIIDTIQSMLGKDFGNSTLSLDLIQEYFAIKSLLGRTASLYKEKFELYLTNPESKKPPMFDEFKQIYDEITEDEIRQRINEMGEKSSMSILQKVDIDYLMEEVRRTLAAEMFVKQYVYSSANTLNQGLQGEQSLGLINEVTNEPYSELYQLLYSDEQSSQTMHSPIEIIEQADILIDRAGLRNEFDFIGNQIQAILNYVNIERVENGLMSYDTFAKRQLMKDFVNQRGENSSEGGLYEITAKQKANEKMKGKDWFNPNSITSIIAVAQTEIATMEKELLAQRLSYFLTNPNNFDVLSQYGMIIDEKETLNEELSEDERNYIMDKNIVLLYGERHTDKNTKGQVDKKKINILKRNDDGTFTKVTISFDNKFIGLEEFVKFVNNNFKYEELRGISKAVAPFTAWTSRIYTILSPLFPTKNLFKDLMVTPWLPAKELNGKNSQYAIKNFYNAFNNLSFILKMSFTEKSFSKKGFENKLKARSQELFEYYLEYSKQHSIFSIEDQIGALSKENKTLQDIEKALSSKENKFIKFTERALLIKFMQHYAELFENLHKFSAYVTLRKLGYGEERSAQIANNATLNYDRSGSIGRQLNAIIPFAKAALGGLYRTNYLLPKYNPKGFLQRVITLAVLGVMQGLMYDPDDDDISEFARKSGMVFGSFLYPLLPEELSIVRPVRALVIVMAGKKSPAYFKQELMESTIDLVPIASDALRGAFSYNPLTNKTEFDVGQLFANTDKMTAVYALAMLASYINENKNSFGKNVLLNEETNTDKTRYGRTKQDYGLYDYLARLYNSILNGVDIDDRAAMSNKIGKNGERLMTIAKEDVEFVINNYIPFGRLYAYTAEIIYDAVNDKRINKGHIPLIGGLFAQKSFGKDYYLVNNIKYELKDFTNDFSQSQIEDIKTNILVKAKNMEGLRYKALKDNPNARPRMLDKAKQNMNDAFNVFILDINNFVNDNGDKKIDFTEDEYKFMLKSFLDSPIMKKALIIGEDTLNKHTAKRVERTYNRYKNHNNENIDTDKENMKDAAKNFKKMLYDKSITEKEFNNKLNSLYEPLFQQIKLRAKFAGYSIE